MAGQGKSATVDEMPVKDNFFAQLDTEDDTVVEPVMEAAKQNLKPAMGDEFEQEADRL